MDPQSFIASGILEAYVAGQCNATEKLEVERMVARHPEIRAELANIEQALEQYAQANAITPPAGLKERIMDQLDQKPGIPSANPGSKNATSSLRLYQGLTILLAALASFFFWKGMFNSRDIEQLKQKTIALQTEIDDCARHRDQAVPMANLLRDTDTRPVTLTDGKAYHITVFNNNVRKECALDISGLPLPAKGYYFQCWAIIAGKPVSLGMVHMDATSGWQPLPYHEKVEAYAISEESNPEGNATPTTVIASGALSNG